MHTSTLPAPHETSMLPKIYRAMWQDGFFHKRHPNHLRFSNTRWLTPESIQDHLQEEGVPILLPFARNLQGDVWCWYKGWEINGAVPVVFASYNGDDVMGYAPDFAGCVYRMFLEEMAACHLVGESIESPNELPHLFQWYAQNLQRHLPTDWGYTLQSLNLANRPIFQVGHATYAILFQEQVEEIIARDLGFSGLNQEIRIAANF